MKRIVIIFLTLCCTVISVAQTVTNVVAKQVGNIVEISYDIDQKAITSLLLSLDGGKTFTITPQTIIGDIGEVSQGHHKMIWDILSDGIDWEFEKACFKVIVRKIDKIEFSVSNKSIGTCTFSMILVEGGTFTMGSTTEMRGNYRNDEYPAHEVTLDDYYIGRTEVTEALWEIVMGNKPRRSCGESYPIEYVSWLECQEFVKKLNILLSLELGHRHFALPTEAQWEYAAIGGKKRSLFPKKYSGSDNFDLVAWYRNNSSNYENLIYYPSKVGQKEPNELGIYDMSGNVAEWCQDWHGEYPSETLLNPTGPTSGKTKIFRGGSHDWEANDCTNISRGGNSVDCSSLPTGLRLVLIP